MKRSITWGIAYYLVLVLVLAYSLAASEPKYICKTSHLGPMSVAVTCLNGADPTGTKVGDTLIISCGR